MKAKRKRGLWRVIEKYLLNPQMRFALRRGLAPANFALLETTGRRSGLTRHTPVGGVHDGDAFWLVAEHGQQADYVKNLLADPRVRIKSKGRWYTGSAIPLPDEDGHQRRQRLDQAHGASGRIDGLIFRAAATEPLTVRIDLDQTQA